MKQQHSEFALQAHCNISHLIFLLLSLAKPSSCVNLTCQNGVITDGDDSEQCIMHEVWCAWYTLNPLQKPKEEEIKSISPGMHLFLCFCYLQTCLETLNKWFNCALGDNYLHYPQMGWEHLHHNHESLTDDLLPVTSEWMSHTNYCSNSVQPSPHFLHHSVLLLCLLPHSRQQQCAVLSTETILCQLSSIQHLYMYDVEKMWMPRTVDSIFKICLLKTRTTHELKSFLQAKACASDHV